MTDPGPARRRLALRMLTGLLSPFSALVRVWRRSLQLRAVLTTILLAAVVVGFVATIIQRQIVDGIVDAKVRSAVDEATRGFSEAQRTLDAGRRTGGVETNVAKPLLLDFAERYATPSFEILIQDSPKPGESATTFRPIKSVSVSESSISKNLRAAVVESEYPQRTYGPIIYSDTSHKTSEPALIIGSRLTKDGNAYEIYYLFRLNQEQQTIEAVRKILIGGSALLLGLIGLVAWFVVRRTVSPVRQAARIAERLAAGSLQERMHVRGEDDMARLATSFNRMATSLQRQIKQLEDLSRMQQRFASDVSHELRTPLTTVRMAADVLHDARPQLDPSAARAAELLQNELGRFENLLAELLEISRFDAGVAVLDTELVDCRDLARHVVANATALADRSGTPLVLDLPADECVAEVDPRRITRILRNLVENAIEHGEGRTVEIAVGADEDTVAFTVRDHGIGLKPGEAASVFNRFWRADPSRRRTLGGTGLGLAIALEDTHLHDGWLQAWGRPGVGSKFRLTLPRARGGVVEASPLAMVPVGRSLRDGPLDAVGPSSTDRTETDHRGSVGAGIPRG